MTSEGISWFEVLRSLAAHVSCFLAVLLVAAAIDKVVRWEHTKSVVHRFAGVRQALTGTFSAAVVVWEFSAAGALLLPQIRLAGAAAAALLWCIYLGRLVRAVVSNRREVDCGCSFGTQIAGAHRSLGAFEIVRNAALVSLACLVAAVSALDSIEVAASQVLAAFVLLALYAALDQVMSLQPLRRGEVS